MSYAMHRGSLGLFDEGTVAACESAPGNYAACASLCFAIGATGWGGSTAPSCTAICLKESCGGGALISGPDLKKGLPGVVPGWTPPADEPPPVQPAEPGMFPWGQPAPETAALQSSLNQKLVHDGLCPIGTDGKLGAKTCGAAQHYGAAPPTCQAFTEPTACPGGGGDGGGGGGAPPEVKAGVGLGALALVAGAVGMGLWFWMRSR